MPEMPPHWSVSFEVDDTDAATFNLLHGQTG
jgi:hypothetical protein